MTNIIIAWTKGREGRVASGRGPSRDSCDKTSGPVLGETYHSTRLRRITILGSTAASTSTLQTQADARREGHGSLACFVVIQ